MAIEHNVGDLLAVTTHFDRNAREFVTTGGKDIVSTIKEAIVLIVGQESYSKVRLVGTDTEIWVLKSYICHNITQMAQKEAQMAQKEALEEYINNFCVEFDTFSSNSSQEEFGEGLVDYTVAVYGDCAISNSLKFLEANQFDCYIENIVVEIENIVARVDIYDIFDGFKNGIFGC